MEGDEARLEEVDAVVERLADCDAEIARLTRDLELSRGREDLAGNARRAAIDRLWEDTRRARAHQREALRHRARLIRDELTITRPGEPGEIRRVLGRDAVLLAYSLSGRDAFLFLVPPAGEEIRTFSLRWPDGTNVTEGSASQAVEAFRSLLVREGRRARGVAVKEAEPGGRARERAGRRLFAALVPAAVWTALREARRVYLVPDGALADLPFEALVVGEEEGTCRYWLDEGPPIAYAASGSVLAWSRRRREDLAARAHVRRIVALGDPVFRRAAGPIGAAVVPERGVLLLDVPAESPAGRAGLWPGDVLTAYDGAKLEDHRALRDRVARALADREDGARGTGEVPVEVWRDGETRRVTLPVGPLGARVAEEDPRIAMRGALGDRSSLRALERGGLLERYRGLEPLPGTRREVESIVRAVRAAETPWGVESLLGDAATEGALYRLAPRARYLHLATHCLAEETAHASYSSLALTPPTLPSDGDDGFLRLVDLLLHWRGRLRDCEMVVLSACETRRGERQAEGGVYAMPWGFLYAGAPTVIASLWRVDDECTADLMAEFYGRLARGERELEAFAASRRALRASKPEPYFWAPFIVVGEPR
jgi:CHAT domain-containing protein